MKNASALYLRHCMTIFSENIPVFTAFSKFHLNESCMDFLWLLGIYENVIANIPGNLDLDDSQFKLPQSALFLLGKKKNKSFVTIQSYCSVSPSTNVSSNTFPQSRAWEKDWNPRTWGSRGLRQGGSPASGHVVVSGLLPGQQRLEPLGPRGVLFHRGASKRWYIP